MRGRAPAFPRRRRSERAKAHSRRMRATDGTASERRGRVKRAVGTAKPKQESKRPREVAAPSASADLTPIVGANLRRLRTKRGLSLERLAQASGVSRAMLGQVELGHSTPTINVVWKIARALDLPFSALITDPGARRPAVLRGARMRILTSHDGAFVSRALFPFDVPREVEFYELRLAPKSVEKADPHPAGTKENLVVVEGALELAVSGDHHRLESGDAILFDADVAHEYWNRGDTPLRMFLVMTYTMRGTAIV